MPELRRPVSVVVQELGPNPTKAERIRALHKEGYTRSEIAECVGVRYQYVRNVLVDDKRLKQTPASTSSCGMAESPVPFEGTQNGPCRTTVGKDGSVHIPDAVRKAAGVKEGDVLLVRFEGEEIRLYTFATAGRRVQARVKQYIPEGVSLAEELIAERRREAERERRGE